MPFGSRALAVLALTAPVAASDPLAAVDHDLVLDAAQLQQLGAKLPEAPGAGLGLASGAWSSELVLREPARVRVAWVATPGGSRPSLGAFTYADDGAAGLEHVQLLLPDASANSLAPGQGASVRHAGGLDDPWPAGTRVGLFLVPDGWNAEPAVQSGSLAGLDWPSHQPGLNAGAAGGRGLATNVDGFNVECARGAPELARRAVLQRLDDVPGLEHGLLLGFEAEDRLGAADDDFNDAVFVITSDPPGAFDLTALPAVELGDPDGDGVHGVADHYPWDAQRAHVERVPAHGWNALGFEDLYPDTGDRDYNDLVLATSFLVVSSANGRVHDMLATLHLMARGASYDHIVGLHLPDLPAVSGSVFVEHFLSDAAGTHAVLPPWELADVVAAGARFEDLFPSTAFALQPAPGFVFVNTQTGAVERPAASARLLISPDEAVEAEQFGVPPYDTYVLVNDGLGFDVDVHLPGKPAFAQRREGLPEESGPEAFLDEDGLPWLIEVPVSWRFPLEAVDMAAAYDEFLPWAASHGTLFEDWTGSYDPDDVSPELAAFLVERDWTLTLPPAGAPSSDAP